MKQSKISDDNYFQVTGWMLNRLHLKGISLEVFAIIYGFSQDGESEFTGSIQYLCDFTGTSRPTVIKALKELVSNNYIIKNEFELNGAKFNKYKANLQVVKNFNGGSKETLQGGSKETLPNNKYINNKYIDNELNNKKNKKKKDFSFILEKYSTDEEVLSLLNDWLDNRKAKHLAMTESSIKLNLNKLDKMASESNMSVKDYLTEVVCRGWGSFFVINNYGNNQAKNKNDGWCFNPNEEDDLDFIK